MMYRVYKTRILGCRNTLSSCFKNCSLSPVWSLTQNTQKSWTQSIPIFAGCISYYYYQKWWAVCSLFQKLDFIACRVLDSKVLHWIGRSVRRFSSKFVGRDQGFDLRNLCKFILHALSKISRSLRRLRLEHDTLQDQ